MSTPATVSALAWMLLSPSQIRVDILALKVTLGVGAFGEQLDHAGAGGGPEKAPCLARRQREHNQQ